MTRSRANAGHRPATRPFDQQELGEEGEVAAKVRAVMEAIREFDQDKVTAAVWWKPGSATGSWKWCDDVALPPDVPAIMADMRDRFGPGEYEIRVSALGRIRGNILFGIAKERTPAMAPAPAPNQPPAMGMGEIFGLMMTQQSEARREATAAAERQTQMLTTLAAAIIPALITRPTPAAPDLPALINALRPAEHAGGMKETIETLAAMRDLIGGPGGGQVIDGDTGEPFDTGDLIRQGGRLIGPMVKSLADMVNRRQDAAPGAPGAAPGAEGPPGLMLPHPNPAPAPGAPPAPAPSRYRVIELVRDDVLYLFGRDHDPAKAADLIFDIIDANQVTDEEIAELSLAFALSPDGLEALAREGIDLRSRPQWAADFFDSLRTIATEGEAPFIEPDDGRQADLAGDGRAREGGI